MEKHPTEPAGALPPWDRNLAYALLWWYDKTHGNGFGHDHHCPVRATNEPFQEQPDNRCTCGWSDVLVAEKARYEATK